MQYLLTAAGLDDTPTVHDRHAMTDLLDNCHIVRNEQVAQVQTLLQLLQQRQYLSLN